MNRLMNQTSPYLLQHADNPVHWYAWGEEAFAAARAQDKPILLSVGYSACHWCHVMAHESFEDEETAELMNRLYINIKVDREERPDVDDIYMGAVQVMTRSGGWPMTVFLLPDGRPFYGGTYYPKEPAYGRPSFTQILEGVYDAFANRREQVEEAATNLKEALGRDLLGIGGDEQALNADLLDTAVRGILRGFDPEWGGFSAAPKFPQPMNLDFLLRAYVRTKDAQILDTLTFTLRKMATGGIYDQIGGGFARYSVDRYWLVPHFEKMLYDNAQLSRVYLRTGQVTGDDFFRRIAEEIYDYILREMTAPEGGFYSATDADSEGEEGKFFVWIKAELEALLGADAPIAIEYWGVSTRGNFEGHNILHVPNDDALVAERLGISVDELRAAIERSKNTLYAHRSQRVHPLLDDKQLASWNGMMLASLAEAARLLKREDYRTAAVRCGEFVLRAFITEGGRITRTHKNGESRINGVLEDYANLIDALLELYQLTFEVRWFTAARQLADTALAHFAADDGGFYDTSDDHETLIVRPRNVQDNATPSGNSMLAKGLLRLAAYTGDARYAAAARGGLRLLTEAMRQYPGGFGEALNATDMLVNGIAEVALVGSLEDEATHDLLRVASHPYRPNVVIALSASNVEGEAEIPLLSYRTLRGGRPTVYVCRNFVCKLPVNTADEMRALLDEQAEQR